MLQKVVIVQAPNHGLHLKLRLECLALRSRTKQECELEIMPFWMAKESVEDCTSNVPCKPSADANSELEERAPVAPMKNILVGMICVIFGRHDRNGGVPDSRLELD